MYMMRPDDEFYVMNLRVTSARSDGEVRARSLMI